MGFSELRVRPSKRATVFENKHIVNRTLKTLYIHEAMKDIVVLAKVGQGLYIFA